jgi:hypothetical protein
MKRSTRFFNFFKFGSGLLLLTILLHSQRSYGQFYERVYATSAPETDVSSTAFLASVSAPASALAPGGEVQAASTLSVDLGVGGLVQASQNIRFGSAPVAGTPVTAKIETESLLGLGNSVTVTATQDGDPVGVGITGENLLNLLGGGVLSGSNSVSEVTFIPKDASGNNVNYNGVRVRITTEVGLGLSVKFYHAYYLKTRTTPLNCDLPVDVAFGVNGSIANLAAGVTAPYGVLSGNTSTLQTGVTAGGSIFESVIFSGQGSGEVVATFSKSANVVATATLLNGITIAAYNGSTLVTGKTLGDLLLELSLLNLFNTQGQSVTVRFPATGPFDRITISTGGTLSVLGNVNISNVKRLPIPTVTTANVTIYSGQTATLTASSANSTDVLTWFNSSNVEVGTGISITVSPTVTSSYTVVARSGASCTDNSAAATATITVLPAPTFTNPTFVVVGKNYTGTDRSIALSGGQTGSTYAYANASGLPAGLTLNSDGTITGTPTGIYPPGANTVNFTADVVDATLNLPVGTGLSFSIVVYGALTANATDLPDSYVGSTVYATAVPTPTGGSGSVYNYVVTSGATPPGLTFGTDGTITGSPTVAGSYTFTITITDPVSVQSVSQTYTVVISPQLLLPGGTFPATYVDTPAYSESISSAVITGVSTNGSATGGKSGATLTYSLNPPSVGGRIMAVPTDFTLSSAGVLSGDPGAAGVSVNDFTIYVTDGEQVASATYRLVVQSALPVTLASFTVTKEGESAQLAWSTTSESNSASFEVQRSGDGKKWNAIGNRAAKGQSDGLVPYNFTDNNPLDGENLYRLKMIDKDATSALSGIQSVKFALEALKLYPNPISASEPLNIQVKNWDLVKTVKIYNALGKVVFESAGNVKSIITTERLTAGLYVVQVTHKDGQVISSRFVKR